MADSALEYVLKRDRAVVLAGLAGVTALAWVYIVTLAGGMEGGMAGVKPWGAHDFLLMFLMWSVMMVGMMMPSAAPMILLFAMVGRRARERNQPFVPVGVFAAGYVIAWSAFSLGATMLQWAFEQAALLSPMMVSTSPALGGGLLIAAGLYQWTPIKDVCLRHCRSPLGFLATGWRPGKTGALRMGIEHGLFCVGCCWVLMGLLFFGGVMNLLWIAAIAAFVFVEKIALFGRAGGRIGGVMMIAFGVAVIATA